MTIKLLQCMVWLSLITACQSKQSAPTNFNATNKAIERKSKGLETLQVKRYDNPTSSILQGVAIPKGKKTFLTSGLVAPLLDSTAAKTDAHKRRGDTYTQSIHTLKRIEKILQEAGLEMKDVVYLRVYIAPDTQNNQEPDFDAWFKAYNKFFNNAQNPTKVARTTLGVYRLARPDILVEVEAVAIYPE
ncbi:RidA family protein [uncultured Microscilla sp.]|uniref:RidA family protein n=1 Tax=uncultured Microscilla sp. TaxID=432653 RepID=UPI0026024ECA|nr:RidA family protein [uncultured Microscilla sp.]